MAHLITSHDPFHVHKVLGLLVLLHYIYRYYLVFALGTAFPGWSYSSSSSSSSTLAFDAACVLLHGFLSWSSLLLPLPRRRNFNMPMIWPEFRLHSILFATRHVVCALVSLAGMWRPGGGWSGSGMMGHHHSTPIIRHHLDECLLRLTIVLGTTRLASIVSRRYGDAELRTTNSMPYPRCVMPEQIVAVRASYATAQFGATITCLSDDPSLNFAPLLGIQIAPLLMTLVRKGKIGSRSYHACYAACLCLGYVIVFVRMLSYVRINENYDNDDGGGGGGGGGSSSGAVVGAIGGGEDDDDDEYGGTYRATSMLLLFALPFSKARREWKISATTFWWVTVPFATMILPTTWRLLAPTVVSTSTAWWTSSAYSSSLLPAVVSTKMTTRGVVTTLVWIGIVKTFSRMSNAYAPLFLGIGTSTSTTTTTTTTREGDDEDDDDDRGDDDGRTEASSSASSLSD